MSYSQKEEPKYQCDGTPCKNGTDEVFHKMPLCEGCKTKVREYRRKRKSGIKTADLS